jgi:hypothetical protein
MLIAIEYSSSRILTVTEDLPIFDADDILARDNRDSGIRLKVWTNGWARSRYRAQIGTIN